ncbi:MAG: APC family permease [Bacillaceae bacterium]
MAEQVKLKRTLSLWQISIMGVAYMTPMVVFDSFGIITKLTDGKVAAAYIFTLVAIIFTAFSYGQMVRAFPIAGSAYTYAQQTLHPIAGFIVGWTVLIDYLLLPVVNTLLPTIYLGALFPDVHPFVWVFLSTIVYTIFNLLSVKLTANVGAILVGVQFLICFIFVFLTIKQTPLSSYSIDPLISTNLGTLVAGAAILTYSFLGFDSVSTLSEDTINPKKNVPLGILYTALIGGGLFIFVAYFAQILFPSASMFKDVVGASPEIAYKIGGTLFQSFFVAGATVGIAASGLISHMSASRLLYAMGRDNVLPKKIFGYLSPKTSNPTYNIWIISGVCLIPGLFMLGGMTSDELTALVFELVSFGALVAFSVVNLGVILHYFIKKKKRSGTDIIKYLISPLIGFGFIVTLWLNLSPLSLKTGLVWTAIGIAYITILYYIKKSTNSKFDVPVLDLDDAQ